MLKKIILSILFASASLFPNLSLAGGLLFEPIDSCKNLDSKIEFSNAPLIILWASGYIAGKSGLSSDIHELGLFELEDELNLLCEQSPNLNYIALVEKYIQLRSNDLGTPNQGKKMLEDFFASDQSLADFFKSLEPQPNIIGAVYKEPLATNLAVMYKGMFANLDGLELDPKYDLVLLKFSTTNQLAFNESELNKFPGGYEKVKDYFIYDYPIATFEFVENGKTSGLRFDGLIFVAGRWVLMPKPWRGLE